MTKNSAYHYQEMANQDYMDNSSAQRSNGDLRLTPGNRHQLGHPSYPDLSDPDLEFDVGSPRRNGSFHHAMKNSNHASKEDFNQQQQQQQQQPNGYAHSNGRPANYDNGDLRHRRRRNSRIGLHDIEGPISTRRKVTEWFVCLLLDVILPATELIVGLVFATRLRDQGFNDEYYSIILLFIAPSLVNAGVWLKLKSSYKSVGFLFMLAVSFLGFPSPIFVYIWHLYLTAFGMPGAPRSKLLANSFRIVQAFCCSLPLILLNLIVLLSIMKVEGSSAGGHDGALDLSYLSKHLAQGTNVQLHGLAACVSFANILRAASVFNERKTFALLFVMIGYPFLLFTVLSRTLALGIILAFLDVEWIVALFVTLIATNAVLYIVCRKTTMKSLFESASNLSIKARNKTRAKSPNQNISMEKSISLEEYNYQDVKNKKMALDEVDNPKCFVDCVNNEDNDIDLSPSSAAAASSRARWSHLPRLLLYSTCSSVIPLAYTNDKRSHHPRIKGGTFITLNYLFNTLFIGLTLGLTIVNRVPNTIRGVALPQPSLKIEVPDSKVVLQTGGFGEVSLNLPKNLIDLGSMPSVSATVNTDSTDAIYAAALPAILAIITIPFVVMRAAMTELDCFVTRKKEVEDSSPDTEDEDDVDTMPSEDTRIVLNRDGHSTSTTFSGRRRRAAKRSLRRAVRENAEHGGLKSRLYVTICCSVFGMVVFTMLLGLASVGFVMQLL